MWPRARGPSFRPCRSPTITSRPAWCRRMASSTTPRPAALPGCRWAGVGPRPGRPARITAGRCPPAGDDISMSARPRPRGRTSPSPGPLSERFLNPRDQTHTSTGISRPPRAALSRLPGVSRPRARASCTHPVSPGPCARASCAHPVSSGQLIVPAANPNRPRTDGMPRAPRRTSPLLFPRRVPKRHDRVFRTSRD